MKKEKAKYIGFSFAILAVFTVLLAIIDYIICKRNVISYDCSYQYALMQHSFSEMLSLIPADYSPPLYAVLLKLFCMLFGYSLGTMRVFTLIIYVALFALYLFPLRWLLGTRTAVLSAVIMFFTAYMLYFLPVIRPTNLALFSVTGAAIYGFDCYKSKTISAFIKLTVFAVISVYTHNAAMLYAIGIYVALFAYFFLKRDKKHMLITLASGVATAAAYLPWLSSLLTQVSHVANNYWSSNKDFFWCFKFLFNTAYTKYMSFSVTSPLFFSIGVCVCFLMLLCLKKKRTVQREIKIKSYLREYWRKSAYKYQDTFFVFCEILTGLALLALVHIYFHPIITFRYVYIYCGTMAIVAAMSFSYIGNLKSTVVSVCIFGTAWCSNAWNVYVTLDDSLICEYAKQIREENPDGDIVFLQNCEHTLGVLSYYLPGAVNYVHNSTYTVLMSYDVFSVEVINIGDIENIWDYTNEIYVLSDFCTDNEIPYPDNYEIYEYEASKNCLIEYTSAYKLVKIVNLEN